MVNRSIFVTGKWQPDKISNGLADARNAILAKNPNADIVLRKWKEDGNRRRNPLGSSIRPTALDIAENWTADSRLILAGHSFGVWYCNLLASALNRYHIPVAYFFSADGVNRPLGTSFVVPPNVKRYYSFRQRGVISGSDFITHAFDTQLIANVVLPGTPHAAVDENSEFQRLLIQAVLAA